MRKNLSPSVIGVIIGLAVMFAFIFCYSFVTTHLGSNRPVSATPEDVENKVRDYCNETIPAEGEFRLPDAVDPTDSCCFLYGTYTENGQDYLYVTLVAKQVLMKEYSIRSDLMGFTRYANPSWPASGEVTTKGYIFTTYTAHFDFDENGATVTYERHIKFLDLISAVLLFTMSDFAARGIVKNTQKKKAAEGRAKA